MLLAAVLVKLVLAAYLFQLGACASPETVAAPLARAIGDTPSYLDAIDNYIETGEYFFWNGAQRVRASRMPHYGTVYYAFRLFLGQRAAYTAVALTQIVAAAAAALALAAFAWRVTQRRRVFFGVLVLELVTLQSASFDLMLLPESLSVSALCGLVLFQQRALEEDGWSSIALSGACLAVLVALKPYMVCLVPVVLAERWYRRRREDQPARLAKQALVVVLLVALPILPWTIRNYGVYGRLVPFQINIYAGYLYSDADLAVRRFIQSWGGSFVWWDKRSAGCYFQPSRYACDVSSRDIPLAEGYVRTDIERVRAHYVSLQANRTPEGDQRVAREVDRLTDRYRADHWLAFHLIAPLKLVREFLFHSGSYFFPVAPGQPCFRSFHWVMKLAQSGLYYLALSLGTVGLVLVARGRRITLLPVLVPLYLIALFCVVLRAPEFRYFLHAHPLLLLGVGLALGGAVRPERSVDLPR